MCASSTANSSGSESNNKARNTAGAKTHKAAEIRIETETSTAGEAGGHRAPRPPHQVLHASGARGRPVQHADEPAGAEHFKRKSQEGDKYCFRGSQAHSMHAAPEAAVAQTPTTTRAARRRTEEQPRMQAGAEARADDARSEQQALHLLEPHRAR